MANFWATSDNLGYSFFKHLVTQIAHYNFVILNKNVEIVAKLFHNVGSS